MEEEKGVRYDAKKLAVEVLRKWQALIVITLLVAVIFCVVSITGSAAVTYEAKEGFSITYPEIDYPTDGSGDTNAGEILNLKLAEQQRAVARAVDTLNNTVYINVYNALENTDGTYKMDGLKSGIKLELGNSNTTLTVTVSAESARDAVFMLDNIEQQVKAAIGSGETEGFSVQLTYKNAEEDLNAMYAVDNGGALSVIISVVEGLVIGFVVGGLSGYFGGTFDFLAMRFVEFLMAVPGLYLLLAMRSALAPHFDSAQMYIMIVVILSFIGWASTARVIRGMALSLSKAQYVQAAKAMGESPLKIIVKHFLPNVLSYLIVGATLSIPAYVLGEAALSFLGLGIQEPSASWGLMLAQAQNDTKVLMLGFWWMLAPGGAIFATVLTFNMLGDILRDIADPKKDK